MKIVSTTRSELPYLGENIRVADNVSAMCLPALVTPNSKDSFGAPYAFEFSYSAVESNRSLVVSPVGMARGNRNLSTSTDGGYTVVNGSAAIDRFEGAFVIVSRLDAFGSYTTLPGCTNWTCFENSGVLQVRLGGSGTLVSTSLTGLFDGTPVVISWGPSGCGIYKGGIALSTTATKPSASAPSGNLLWNSVGTSSDTNGWTAMVAVVSGRVDPLALSSNPYDALFRRRRRYFHSTGTGPTLPTLSAATYMPGSLTSSGFRPRVTAS